MLIAPLFNSYRPLPAGPVRDGSLQLARANGVPAANVYVVNASRQSTRISTSVSGLGGSSRISRTDSLLLLLGARPVGPPYSALLPLC